VPGIHVNDRQVQTYMNHRRTHAQEAAAAKVGISTRSGRRIERDPTLPSQRRHAHDWRTRPDPFADVWDSEIAPLLNSLPGLQAVTILRELQRRHAGRFPDSQLRTLQRHIRLWRARYGAERDVIFRQDHPPGALGLSDFTAADELAIVVAGQPFPHRLYHFALAHSQWEYARVVEGGESFTALAEGLQNALWLLGGAPAEHRTDSLSAAYRNLDQAAQDDLTGRYEQVCAHYGMRASRNNRGQSHENGAIESPHRHLKQALDQALMLRGTRAFDSRADYQRFVEETIARRNAARERVFAADRVALRPLPERRTTDFTEATVLVTSSSMFTLKNVYYTVPSRLIGHRLRVHLYDDRLECFLASAFLFTLPRGRVPSGKNRSHVVDYRHVLSSLRRKPGALRTLAWRDALFPLPAFRQAWEVLTAAGSLERACRAMVTLLDLAARHGEAPVAHALEAQIAAGGRPDPEALLRDLAPAAADALPVVEIVMPAAPLYDALLPSLSEARP
jgi:hypothetical protein